MSSIKGKTVLITGGASGIGKLMGEKLLKAGAEQLVIWDINRENLDKTSSELKAGGFIVFPHSIDISDTDKVVKLAKTVKKEAGSVDILINNAGVVAGKKFANLSHKEIDFTMNVNSLAIMRPLHSKRLHSNICFFIGEANFRRINRLIQGSLTKHMGKQILPAGKTDIGQSSRNKNSQANLLAHQILIFKSCPILTFCGGAYCAVAS